MAFRDFVQFCSTTTYFFFFVQAEPIVFSHRILRPQYSLESIVFLHENQGLKHDIARLCRVITLPQTPACYQCSQSLHQFSSFPVSLHCIQELPCGIFPEGTSCQCISGYKNIFHVCTDDFQCLTSTCHSHCHIEAHWLCEQEWTTLAYEWDFRRLQKWVNTWDSIVTIFQCEETKFKHFSWFDPAFWFPKQIILYKSTCYCMDSRTMLNVGLLAMYSHFWLANHWKEKFVSCDFLSIHKLLGKFLILWELLLIEWRVKYDVPFSCEHNRQAVMAKEICCIYTERNGSGPGAHYGVTSSGSPAHCSHLAALGWQTWCEHIHGLWFTIHKP